MPTTVYWCVILASIALHKMLSTFKAFNIGSNVSGLRFFVQAAAEAADSAIEEAINNLSGQSTSSQDGDKKEELIQQGPTVESLQEELKNIQNQNLYLVAEVENARRRFEKLATELELTAVSTLAKKLLPVADNMKRVETTGEKQTVKQILEAVGIIDNEFHNILKGFQVIRMESKGTKFDPKYHDAIAIIDTKGEVQQDHIVDVITEGYTLGERLLRAAKVVVSK